MIDNIRFSGTGALNVGALRDEYGFWPEHRVHPSQYQLSRTSDRPSEC